MQASRRLRSHASYACTYDKEKQKLSQLKPIQSKQVEHQKLNQTTPLREPRKSTKQSKSK